MLISSILLVFEMAMTQAGFRGRHGSPASVVDGCALSLRAYHQRRIVPPLRRGADGAFRSYLALGDHSALACRAPGEIESGELKEEVSRV